MDAEIQSNGGAQGDGAVRSMKCSADVGIVSMFDEISAHCPSCGWSAFPHEAENGFCPDCGGKVNPPNDPHEQTGAKTKTI